MQEPHRAHPAKRKGIILASGSGTRLYLHGLLIKISNAKFEIAIGHSPAQAEYFA